MTSIAKQKSGGTKLFKIIHAFISNSFPPDSETKEERYKTFVLIYSVLLGLSLNLILILLNSFMQFNTSGIYLPGLLFGGFYLLLLKWNVNLVYIGNIIAFGFFILLVLDALSSGGIYYIGLFWTILVPIFAFCFANLKSGILWTGIVIAYAITLYNLEINAEQSFLDIVIQTPELHLIGVVGLFLFVTMMLGAFRRGNDLIIEELKEQKELVKAEQEKTLQKAKMLQLAQDSLVEKNKVLEKAQHQLSQKNQELEQFAFATSHDLKSPLRTITSFTQLLNRHLEKTSLNDEYTDKYINFIINGSNSMNVFISDLLDYARIGIEKNSFVETDLNELLSSVKESLFESIQATDTIIICENLPTLAVIPVKISQLFQNLISNAIKFRKKEESLVLNISVEKLPLGWKFIFKDNGIGINEENLSSIFEPFKKLHSKTEYCGSGIGLSTCRKIAEMHNGKIWVESTLGEGTSFYVYLQKHADRN